MKKYAGVLLHISSLNNSSIGTLGEEAFKFVDFLEKAKQHLWQVLPLNPTSYGDSPYQYQIISFREMTREQAEHNIPLSLEGIVVNGTSLVENLPETLVHL